MTSKFKMKNNRGPIVVTGGGGYIGTHIVALLLKKGFKVRAYDQFVFGESILGDLQKNKNLEVIKGGIGDGASLSKALKGAYAVIHLAGLVGDPACLVDEQLTIEMNRVSTRIVKELAKAFDVQRFIFASSCSVYGASEKILDEQSKLSPVSLYAKTKIDSEKEILSDKSKNFYPTILRFATVFGHSRRMRFDLVANLFVAQAYNDGVITVTGSKQWRPFIHPVDIAWAVLKVLQVSLKQVDRQIFNVGDERLNITIGKLANLVAKIVKESKEGNDVKIITKDDISDIRNYKVSFKKIKRILNFKATISLEAGLKEIYANFLNRVYKTNYKDPLYINVEMTKLLQMKLS